MKKIVKIMTAFIITTIAMTPCLASAYQDAIQYGRYLTVSNKPKPAQINLLSQIVQVRFPQNIQTVRQAVNCLLRFSGYSLIADKQMDDALRTILSKPLPLIDRQFDSVSLKDVLITLVGSSFYLVDDPINRVVNFRLKPEFEKKYQSSLVTNKRI